MGTTDNTQKNYALMKDVTSLSSLIATEMEFVVNMVQGIMLLLLGGMS